MFKKKVGKTDNLNVKRLLIILCLFCSESFLYYFIKKHQFIFHWHFINVKSIDNIINTGVSFGFFSNVQYINNIMIVVSIVVTLYLLFYHKRFKFIICGIVSNLYFRIKYAGVVDFLFVGLFDKFEFVCNFGDIFIFIGCIGECYRFFQFKK